MATLVEAIEERLKAGGWFLVRESKHKIYRHPNGATHVVPRRISDTAKWRRSKPFAEIEAKEQDPLASGRNTRIIPQEPTMAEPVAAPVPVPTPCVPQAKKVKRWFETISRRRMDAGKTRADLATVLQWTTTQVKKLERGEYTPTTSELSEVLTFLNVTDMEAEFGMVVPTRPDADGGLPKIPTKLPAPAPEPEPVRPPWSTAVDVGSTDESSFPLNTNTLAAWLERHPFPNPSTPGHRQSLGQLLDEVRISLKDTVDVFCKKLGITSGIFYSMKAGRPVSWEQCNSAITALSRLIRPMAPSATTLAPPTPTPGVPEFQPSPVGAVSVAPRAEVLAKAEKILRNHRLTDQEVQQLVDLLQTEAVKLLLGDMA